MPVEPWGVVHRSCRRPLRGGCASRHRASRARPRAARSGHRFDDRLLVLADLVALGQVRVEVVLAREARLPSTRASTASPSAPPFDRLAFDTGRIPGRREVDRRRPGCWARAEAVRRRRREHLASGVSCTCTSRPITASRRCKWRSCATRGRPRRCQSVRCCSRRPPASSRVFAERGTISCRPIGRPPMNAARHRHAGSPARFTATVLHVGGVHASAGRRPSLLQRPWSAKWARPAGRSARTRARSRRAISARARVAPGGSRPRSSRPSTYVPAQDAHASPRRRNRGAVGV